MMGNRALLFDFDGVVVDTEKHYTVFWDAMGEKILGVKGFCSKVKGSTLVSILSTYFGDRRELWDGIIAELNEFERNMPVEYIPGVVGFVREARRRGFLTAVVTSSNREKMESVYAKRPEIPELFDSILTSEDFAASKPDPDCFLRGMKALGSDAAHTVVFEDSINGLKAAEGSGAMVVGLVTTNPKDVVAEYSSVQIPDFTDQDSLFRSISEYIGK